VRRSTRLLALTVPAAALATAVQAAAAPLHAVEPFVSRAPVNAPARVEAATVSTPAPTPTVLPTLAPTPTAAPTPAPTAHVAPPPPPPTAPPTHAPVILTNLLRSDDGLLDTGVGIYSDCSGNTALTHAAAAIDTCVGGITYFVGHNPGVFTPLMSENVGSLITWWDANGSAHRLRIVAVRTWMRADGVPPAVSGAVVAQFQTCLLADGSKDRILDTVPA
jgi:hypothetical protein